MAFPLPPLIPREVLFGNPEKAHPLISPDGSKMAYLAPAGGVLNVWVGSTGGDDYQPITDDRDRGIRVYFWGHDRRHMLYLQDTAGDENWSLHAVDLETRAARALTPFEGVQVQVIDHTKHFPNAMLIGMNREDPRLHDAYHLNLTNGEARLAAKNPGNVVGWVPDAELRVRGALAARADGGMDLLVRGAEGDDWRQLVSWGPEDALNSRPVEFSQDGKRLYVQDSRDANAGRLVEMDVASGALEVLAEDPTYDVDNVITHPDTRAVQMVSFTRARREWVVLDEQIAPDVKAIGGLERGDFIMYDRTDADDRWLVGFESDTAPMSFHAFDRKTKSGVFLFHTRPELTKYALSPMEPVSFRSRDGFTIHGYLSYPPGPDRKNLPLVLNVHGGPWHRDTWGYDPEAQWLANRGYACLQVNFRGSTGYGKAFLNAGDREWGGKMHDDLVDAVDWAVGRGIADSSRIAIYGGSYGGYAALCGATLTPDLFRCAVSIVGPSNLITFINTIPPYWSSYLASIHQRVGHPEKDTEMLIARSPLTHVERIGIPMLIAQGANDPRVKQSESEQIVAAMREKGIDHEYMLFPDEGHGFAKPENRLKFYAAAEKFLAKHLGGRAEE